MVLYNQSSLMLLPFLTLSFLALVYIQVARKKSRQLLQICWFNYLSVYGWYFELPTQMLTFLQVA